MAGAIKNIIIIVKENHTFDNYFGTLAGADGANLPQAPDPPADDPDHRHLAWMNRAADTAHRIQYKEHDIPGYFAYARQYTICDKYFSEVAGPSTPNHLMLICADAPIINNPSNMYRPKPGAAYQLSSLPTHLENAGLTWGNYGGYAFQYVAELAGHANNHTRDAFAQHAAAGKLPAVSWVYGDGHPDLSEHPVQKVTDGMKWTVAQVDAIVKGGLWNGVAIFITWDDWGGWFDHVDPPVVEQWESRHAQRPADAHPEYNGQPFRYGSRVPCLVLSPYARPSHISHEINSHVSIVKFCETIFGLQPLTQRDKASNGMADCFDLHQTPLPPPSTAK